MTTAASRLLKMVLALAIAGVLLGDAAVVVARRDSRSDDDKQAAREVPEDDRRQLEAALPELQSFVEQTRGLRFKTPPEVELLSSEDFDAMLRGDFEEEDEEGDEVVDDDSGIGLLRALGLVEGEVDIDAVIEDQLASVVGFYDSETKVLYARGVSPSPYVKMVLVHELTHALDDQHFGLDRPDLDDEASPAFDALVEGSASVVEMRWYDSRPAGEQAEIDAEEESGPVLGGDDDFEPSVFDRLMAFPYAVGPSFVEALVAAGGQERLNAAFTSPPPTTEQVLHPEKFLAGERTPPIARPTADGPVTDEGRLGQVGLLLMLDSAVEQETALRAAAGWGNDGYVAWTSGARTCVRFNLIMDSARDTTEAASALRAWAAAQPSATVRGTAPIVVTSCA